VIHERFHGVPPNSDRGEWWTRLYGRDDGRRRKKPGRRARADVRRSEETIAGKLAVETKSITDEAAPQYLGFLAAFAGFDNPTSNDKTREALGWEPTHPGWVQDVETGHYFA